VIVEETSCGRRERRKVDDAAKVAAGEMLLSFAHAERQALHSPMSRRPRKTRRIRARRRRASRCMATSPTSSSSRRASRAINAAKPASGCSGRRQAPGVSRRGYPTMDGLRAAEVSRRRQGRRRRRHRRASNGYPLIEQVSHIAIALAATVGAMSAMHGSQVDYLSSASSSACDRQFQVLQHRAGV
jgi:hypothetical protein